MDRFEGVDLNENNIESIVLEQLTTGKYRSKFDNAPGDWLIRAWKSISIPARRQIEAAVNQTLYHTDPAMRVEALATLDMATDMADPFVLVDLAENHFELFKGLQRESDPADKDRGRDFVRLTANVASDTHGDPFRHKMALDATYGSSVLAALARLEPHWTAEHASELVAKQLDPDGNRLNILIFNLRNNPQNLKAFVQNLAKQPDMNGRLRTTIQAKIRDEQLQQELLALVG